MEYRENLTHHERIAYINENFKRAFPDTTPGKLRAKLKLAPLGTKHTTYILAKKISEVIEGGN